MSSIVHAKPYEGWSISGQSGLPTRLGTRIDIKHSDGRQIGLLLELDSRMDRPLLRVSSKRSATVTPGEARPVLAHVVQSIQS